MSPLIKDKNYIYQECFHQDAALFEHRFFPFHTSTSLPILQIGKDIRDLGVTEKFAHRCSQGNLHQPKQGAWGTWAQLGISWLWVPSRVSPLLPWPCLLFKRILSFAECQRMGTFCYRDCLSNKCADYMDDLVSSGLNIFFMLDLVLGIPPDRFWRCQIQHWGTMLSLNGVYHILCLLIICKLLSVFLAYCFMKMSFFSFCPPRAIKKYGARGCNSLYKILLMYKRLKIGLHLRTGQCMLSVKCFFKHSRVYCLERCRFISQLKILWIYHLEENNLYMWVAGRILCLLGLLCNCFINWNTISVFLKLWGTG